MELTMNINQALKQENSEFPLKPVTQSIDAEII